MEITSIGAYEILASGGYPTIETKVVLSDGAIGIASVPYGASAGSYEATVMNDGEARWNGKGVLRAIENVMGEISDALMGMDGYDQKRVDQVMRDVDGTENKARLGGNAILSVSLAVARAAAASKSMPLYRYVIETFETGEDLSSLPMPMMVSIEGGKHADDTTDLQEYCLSGIAEASVAENVRMVLESYHALKKVLKANKLSTNVGNEGAFAPNGIATNETPFEYMMQAITDAGYTPGSEVGISIDAAASEFYLPAQTGSEGIYHLSIEDKALSSEELVAYYQKWFEKYPIVTMEDSHHEDDWDGWVAMKKMADEHKVDLIGDDLTVTSVGRVQKAIDAQAISAVLIKLNQIGTLSETVETCMLARKHGLMTTTSHRGGGETNDAFMVDVAVAVGSRFIKVGPTRGERVGKYNRLMEIERELLSRK